MTIELAISDEWTPGHILAVRSLLQHVLRGEYPTWSASQACRAQRASGREGG